MTPRYPLSMHLDPVGDRRRPPRSRPLAIGAALGLLALLPGCSHRVPDPAAIERPNVVLYLIDTLRADHLGLYGHERETSPVLDELATGGVVFERAYAHDSRTLGSVPSLLTSLHTTSHGIREYENRLTPGVATLAGALHEADYDTASFVMNMVAGKLIRLNREFAHSHDAIRQQDKPMALRSFPDDEFFGWLDRERTRPFFAYVHTAEPHRPYNPPPPFDTMFDPGYDGRVWGRYGGKRGFRHATDPRDIAHVRALYDGEVRFADAAVGRLVDGLKRRGLLERTLLIVTADHGEELQDHGGWNHGHTVYEELLRVPLVMTGPGLPRARRVREPVQLIDVAPTILERVGVAPPGSFEGQSLLGLLTGRRAERIEDKEIYTASTQAPSKAVLIRGDWKCILEREAAPEDPGGTIELYNLRDDPGETRNRAVHEPARAREMRERLHAWMGRAVTPTETPHEALSAADEAGLRALGYIE